MHRTEGANNAAGLFTEGPPATTVTEEWLNAVQEEIANVIESAGIVLKTAATETNIQLREALLQTVPMPRGYIDGLIMSNAADTDHDINISVGKCRNSGDSDSILFISAMIKQIDAAWAEGTNQGGFPTGLGVVAVDTWYHVFVIMSADGTKVDAGFDTSLTATNLLADATDYSLYRRIGSVLTDAASNIYKFYQFGDDFIWDEPILTTIAASGVVENVITERSPLGVVCKLYMTLSASSAAHTYVRQPDTTNVAPTTGSAVPGPTRVAVGHDGHALIVYTNLLSQIAVRLNIDRTVYLFTHIYTDLRGKDQ